MYDNIKRKKFKYYIAFGIMICIKITMPPDPEGIIVASYSKFF